MRFNVEFEFYIVFLLHARIGQLGDEDAVEGLIWSEVVVAEALAADARIVLVLRPVALVWRLLISEDDVGLACETLLKIG